MAKRVAVAVGVAMAVLAGGGAHAWANRPQITVAPVAGEDATPELRRRMGEALAEGLIASGADVPPPAVEAPYVLRAKIEVDGRSYALRLEMLDRKTGAVVASREDRCEICTEAEAFETANTAASTLKALVFKKPGGPAGAGAATTSVNLQPGPPSAAPPSAVVESTPRPSKGRHVLGWAAIVGGVAAAGAGTYLWGLDGKGTCTMVDRMSCPTVYDTGVTGLGIAGLGALLVGLGVWAIISSD